MIRMSKMNLKTRLLAVAVACIGMLLASCSTPQQETAGEEAAPAPAADQLTPEDVEVYGVRLFRGENGYEVEGQIQNNSPDLTLTEFDFNMFMQDCLPSGVCRKIAEDTATIAANVAPGESAPFTAAPDFSNMPAPEGQLGWQYAVVSTTGATP